MTFNAAVVLMQGIRMALPNITLLLAILISPLAQVSAQASDTSNSTTSPNIGSSHQLDLLSEQTLQAMVSGDWVAATQHANQLATQFPDYALGHLLLAEAYSVTGMSGSLLQNEVNFSTELVGLLQEARSRLHQQSVASTDSTGKKQLIPSELIQVGKHIDHVVLVDLRASTLFLFDTQSTQPALLKQHYISSGEGGFGKTTEGDLKSPLGIYRIHGFRSDDSLPSLYGAGALMLNYPNKLDRALGRTGSGIWLHGNPRTNRSRSPLSSEGCVTMANDYLVALQHQLDLTRTHVILSQSINWHDPSTMDVQRERFHELFNQYRHAWINSRLVDLMTIYAPDALPAQVQQTDQALAKRVSSGSHNSKHKIAPHGIDLATLAALEVGDVSILMNPELDPLLPAKHMVMAFELPGKQPTTVTLYWELADNGYWQIKREDIESGGA